MSIRLKTPYDYAAVERLTFETFETMAIPRQTGPRIPLTWEWGVEWAAARRCAHGGTLKNFRHFPQTLKYFLPSFVY